MSTFILAVRRFMADEEGVAALEYALLAALIALVIVATVRTLGINLSLVFDNMRAAFA